MIEAPETNIADKVATLNNSTQPQPSPEERELKRLNTRLIKLHRRLVILSIVRMKVTHYLEALTHRCERYRAQSRSIQMRMCELEGKIVKLKAKLPKQVREQFGESKPIRPISVKQMKVRLSKLPLEVQKELVEKLKAKLIKIRSGA